MEGVDEEDEEEQHQFEEQLQQWRKTEVRGGGVHVEGCVRGVEGVGEGWSMGEGWRGVGKGWSMGEGWRGTSI